MAHANKVLRSIIIADGGRCVDIFARADGTYGFEEFRRDVEDPSGWFAIGNHSNKNFNTEESALKKAKVLVPWIQNTKI